MLMGRIWVLPSKRPNPFSALFITVTREQAGLGRSLRQVERRIKQWTGLPLRELKGLGKLERAFFETIQAVENGTDNWSDVAEQAGYTDQSHLCRQTRRLTGFAPEELRRRIAEDEGFWCYRVWGFQEQASA